MYQILPVFAVKAIVLSFLAKKNNILPAILLVWSLFPVNFSGIGHELVSLENFDTQNYFPVLLTFGWVLNVCLINFVFATLNMCFMERVLFISLILESCFYVCLLWVCKEGWERWGHVRAWPHRIQSLLPPLHEFQVLNLGR